MKPKICLIISALVIFFSGCSTSKHSASPQVTIPNGSTPVNAPHAPMNDSLRYGDWNHGNGALWVHIPTNGLFTISNADRTLDRYYRLKIPWWRGVRGQLTVTGRRLDASAPPLRYDAPSIQEDGDIGISPCVLYFPGPGYWQITALVESKSLTIVIQVVKIDR